MSEKSRMNPPDNGQPRLSPVAFIALMLALGLGVGIGAIGYRAWFKKDSRAVTPPAKVVQSVETQGQPKNHGLTDPAGDPGSGDKDPGSAYPAQFTTNSLYPGFHPDRHSYVTRCVPGKIEVQAKAKPGSTLQVEGYPAETGRFMAEARLVPGQAFTVTTEVEGESTDYQVRCLPSDFPQWSYRHLAETPKGMFQVAVRPPNTNFHNSWQIIFDQEGTPRWWLNPETATLGGQTLADGTVQWPRGFGDGFGKDERTVIEIHSLDGKPLRKVRFKGAPTDGHEYTRLPNGNVYIMSYKPRLGVDLSSVGGEADTGVLDGAIEELTPDGEVVWSWNSKDHVKLTDIPPRWWKRNLVNRNHTDYNGNERFDIFHLNSIEPWGKNQLVLSTRHTDRVWGISRKTGEVLWTLGGVKGPKSLKVVGDDPYRSYPLAGNHDARITDGNLLSVHDNGTHFENRPPRLVRYRINLKDRTATFIAESRDVKAAPDSHCCGGARKMGTGWVVAWGDNPFVSAFNSKNQLAFRLGLPMPPYRAVPVPDTVTVDDLDAALDRMASKIPKPHPVRPLKFFDHQK